MNSSSDEEKKKGRGPRKKKTAAKSRDIDILRMHLKETSKLTDESIKNHYAPAPPGTIEYIIKHRPIGDKIKREPKKKTAPKVTPAALKAAKSISVWYEVYIKRPIELAVKEIQDGNPKLDLGKDMDMAPWTYCKGVSELFLSIPSPEQLQKDEKCKTILQASAAEYKKMQTSARHRILYAFWAEVNLGAHLWAVRAHLVERNIIKRADVFRMYMVSETYYKKVIRCYEFVLKYNRILYAMVSSDSLYNRITELEVFLEEYPWYAEDLSKPIIHQDPKLFQFNGQNWLASAQNNATYIKAAQDTEKKRKIIDQEAEAEIERAAQKRKTESESEDVSGDDEGDEDDDDSQDDDYTPGTALKQVDNLIEKTREMSISPKPTDTEDTEDNVAPESPTKKNL
jgi:hypothetical protein